MKSLFGSVFKLAYLAITSSILCISSSSVSSAADQYGFPNLNGQVVKLELENTVRVNLPAARAIDNNKLNSFVPDNTDDWKFKVIDNGYGVMFTRVNTNKAITVSDINVKDGTSIVAYEQQGNGRWIDWNPEHVGNGYYLIHLRHNPSQCLNIPGSQSNVWVTTWTCNKNDRDQRFKIEIVGGNSNVSNPYVGSLPRTGGGDGSIPINPPGTTPIPYVQTYVTNITPLYEYWIVSRKQDQTYPWRYAQLDAGHAFTGLIRRDQENVKVYTNGVLTQNYNRDKGYWYAYHGYGFWPDGLRVDRNGCNANSSTDECGDITKILRGQSISQSGYAVRKARVSENRANWIHQNSNWAGCSYYPQKVLPGIAVFGGCNCLDYATRQWYLFSSQREDFRPKNWQPDSPNFLVGLINYTNAKYGEYLDGGNTWQ
jgi:hypothetical protein